MLTLYVIMALSYMFIAYLFLKDIRKAYRHYVFNYVSLGRWTVRQPNSRFLKNLATIFDIAILGSKL